MNSGFDCVICGGSTANTDSHLCRKCLVKFERDVSKKQLPARVIATNYPINCDEWGMVRHIEATLAFEGKTQTEIDEAVDKFLEPRITPWLEARERRLQAEARQKQEQAAKTEYLKQRYGY